MKERRARVTRRSLQIVFVIFGRGDQPAARTSIDAIVAQPPAVVYC